MEKALDYHPGELGSVLDSATDFHNDLDTLGPISSWRKLEYCTSFLPFSTYLVYLDSKDFQTAYMYGA